MSNAPCDCWRITMRDENERLTPEEQKLINLVKKAVEQDDTEAETELEELMSTWNEEEKMEKAKQFAQGLDVENDELHESIKRHPYENNYKKFCRVILEPTLEEEAVLWTAKQCREEARGSGRWAR